MGANLALLSAERAAFLNDTQTEFAKWVQVNDTVELGIDGDMLNAYPDGAPRPSGTVTKVRRIGDAGVGITILTASGQKIHIPVGTTDPGRVWQPTQQTFEDMQYRAMQAGMSSGADAPEADMGPGDMGDDDAVYRGTHKYSIENLEMALASLQTSLSALVGEVSSMRQSAPPAALLGEPADLGVDSDSSDGGAAGVGTFHFASDMSSDSEDGY